MSGQPIPPVLESSSEKPRILVLCFDGTSNQYGGENTNVVKFFSMLRKDCDDEQLCYYQTGVGTYGPPGFMSFITGWISKIVDEAIAWYLDEHVMDGYKFLMDNYKPGDKISIFGFSRGAYTARALAGFLTKIGLLPRSNYQQVTFAYKLYTRTDVEGLGLAKGFKKTYCRPVSIDFLGVWDTVASTGVIMSRNLPFTTNNSYINTFRHALSLDERRAKFVPTFWQLSTTTKEIPTLMPGSHATPAAIASGGGGGGKGNTKRNDTSDSKTANSGSGTNGFSAKMGLRRMRRLSTSLSEQIRNEVDPEEDNSDTTNVKQVWFSGCHSDIGGGAEENSVKHTLANIPLRWMVREVVNSRCGILFCKEKMEELGIHITLPDASYYGIKPVEGNSGQDQSQTQTQTQEQGQGSSSLGTPTPESSQDKAEDTEDATKPLDDELRKQPLWWILEVIPLPFSWQDAEGQWHKRWKFHLGSGRYVNHTGPLLFHQTVKVRMGDKELKYVPAAKYAKGSERYVW